MAANSKTEPKPEAVNQAQGEALERSQPTIDATYAEIQKARNGDREALARFVAAMDNTEDGARLAELLAKIVVDAEGSLLKLMFGNKDLLLPEVMRRKLKQERAELGAETASPLERRLIDRVVLCGLQLHHYETLLSANPERMTIKQVEFQQKRIEGAQRRYLAAIKALAQVRRLQLPAVQVNIGEKQVNVVQGAAQANLER